MSIDRRILIADDDAAIRGGAAELLGPLGYEVLEAESGSQAIDIIRLSLRHSRLHLALLDMNMPDRTGLEVFDLLQEEAPDLPCIFWSGDATEEVQRWALRRGADAFLRKPVSPDHLRDEVRRVLDAHWGHG
jgi:CheY-like chemotaxis protein